MGGNFMSRNKPEHKSTFLTCRAVTRGVCPHPNSCRFAYGIWDRHLNGELLMDETLMERYRSCKRRGDWVTTSKRIDVEFMQHMKKQRQSLRHFWRQHSLSDETVTFQVYGEEEWRAMRNTEREYNSNRIVNTAYTGNMRTIHDTSNGAEFESESD